MNARPAPLTDALIVRHASYTSVVKRMDELIEHARLMEADRAELRAALMRIYKMSDLHMADGDGARDICRAALERTKEQP